MVKGLPIPPRLNRVALALLVAASLSLGSRPLLASPRRGRGDFQAHFDAGIAHYQRGRYKAAAAELAAALEIEDRPDVSFALAQALRQSGDCTGALKLYRELLAGDLSSQRRGAIEDAMAPCVATEREPEEVPEEPASVDPEEVPEEPLGSVEPELERAPEGEEPSVRRASPRWYRDPLGTGLVVVGVAGLGLGGAGLAVADSRFRSADAAGSEKAFTDAIASADRWTSIGVSSLIAGGVLCAAGVVRWVVVAGRDGDDGRVVLIPDPRGGVLVAGEF
jgi:hypothetical protein